MIVHFSTILGVSTDYLLGVTEIQAPASLRLATTTDEGKENGKVNGKVDAPSKTKGTKKIEAGEEQAPYYRLPSNPQILVVTTDNNNNENISLVPVRVAAGYAKGGFIEPEFMRKLPTFSLPDKAYRNGTFRAFQVSGESMQPTLYEGDWVICRYLENWPRDIQDTFVHVVVTEEIPVVKRLLNRLDERGQLTLQSDNPAFPSQFLDGANVREVWRAVGRLSRQFVNPRYDLTIEMSRTRAQMDEVLERLEQLEANAGKEKRTSRLQRLKTDD